MSYRTNGPETADYHFLFSHGAGAGMDHEFMEAVASQLGDKGIRVSRFEFPYMVKRREDGGKRPPDRAPKLIEAFKQQVKKASRDLNDRQQLIIGGKSMGGRMASMLAAEQPTLPVRAVVCLGYPFHPPGKPERFRGDHLASLALPTLIVEGERDTFGTQQEIADFPDYQQVRYQFLEDGDHSFKPRKKSGFSQEQHIHSAVEAIYRFITGLN